MHIDWQSFLSLLIATALFVWLWRRPGPGSRPSADPFLPFTWLRPPTRIGSAETADHQESESPFWYLPLNGTRLGVLIMRLSLLAFYLLALLFILG